MAVVVRKSGAVFGKVWPVQAMVALMWKGIQVLRCYATEIVMSLTERLIDSQNAWTKSSVLWGGYDLALRAMWDLGAGMLGSVYNQEKIMSVSEKFPVITRSKGVVMSGYNFFKKCHRLRKVAEFEPTETLDAPLAPVKPTPPCLVECVWNDELDGVILTIEEPWLLTYEGLYKTIEDYKNRLAEIKKEPSPDTARQKAIGKLENELANYEAKVRKLESEGKDAHSYVYEEKRVVLWSEVHRIMVSPGIITARIDLPFTDIIKNPDGTPKLGPLGRPMMSIGFGDLPVSFRKLYPSGFVKLGDLSQATIIFRAETIVAETTHSGAIASFGSNTCGAKTPEKTHPAALDILTRARLIKKSYTKNKFTKVIQKPIGEGK